MTQLRFVCAQPATLYYAWQVELMINNFIEMGVNPNHIDIVCWKPNGIVPDEWSKLANGYAARFFFYDDTRKTKGYISSIRPNILKQHFQKYTHLERETIFYHDCDIIFTKPIKEWITDEMIGDEKWYGSDTRWYIGHDYIISKGEDVLDKMCEITGIGKHIIQENELNSIGAQYIMKGINWWYWDRVERDSERLYTEITELNNEKIKEDPKHHPLQIWCADMWGVLWGAWRLGFQTICDDRLQFSWGTSNTQDYHKMNIMHNAGVVDGNNGLFFKGMWINELPFNKNLDIKEGTASWFYYNEIRKLETKSVLI